MSKISVIVLGVSDLEKSIAFYRDKVGFELQNQVEEFAFLAAGPVTLMLNRHLRRPERPLAGAMELVIPVENVTARHQELKAAGCTFINEMRQATPEAWMVTFSDPDGHWLTLFGPK